MKVIRVFQCGVLCAGALLFAAQGAFAQDVQKNGEPEKIRIGDQDYTRDDVVYAFLTSAISNQIALSAYIPAPALRKEQKYRSSVLNPDYLDEHYPWLRPLLFPDDLPGFGQIDRWSEPVKIAFGLPYDLKPYNAGSYKGKLLTEYSEWPMVFDDKTHRNLVEETVFSSPYNRNKTFDPKKKRVVYDEISNILPALGSATGLDLTFVGDESGPVNPPAQMRIVLVDQESWWGKTPFKTGGITKVSSGSMHFKGAFDAMFLGAAYFSPSSDYQVDGYFVRDARNKIKFSACYISDSHDPDLLKKLVRECLVRSLGLPNIQTVFQDSVLQAWNDPLFDRQNKRRNILTGTAELNSADKYLLKILYSTDIKPGMTIFEAAKNLSKTGE